MPKFMVNYQISGRMTQIIEADDMEAAENFINEEIEKDDFDCDLEDIDDVNFSVNELIRVERDGKEIMTTYVFPTDKRI